MKAEIPGFLSVFDCLVGPRKESFFIGKSNF